MSLEAFRHDRRGSIGRYVLRLLMIHEGRDWENLDKVNWLRTLHQKGGRVSKVFEINLACLIRSSSLISGIEIPP